MKLTYWYSQNIGDSNAYSIRAKTKREVNEILQDCDPEDYGPPLKVSIEYDNAFDLMNSCSTEDHHHWEYQAVNAHENK